MLQPESPPQVALAFPRTQALLWLSLADALQQIMRDRNLQPFPQLPCQYQCLIKAAFAQAHGVQRNGDQ